MSEYGSNFDRKATIWATIENQHDLHHPDRSDCGGVGRCSMMYAAVTLEHELIVLLEEWRKRI